MLVQQTYGQDCFVMSFPMLKTICNHFLWVCYHAVSHVPQRLRVMFMVRDVLEVENDFCWYRQAGDTAIMFARPENLWNLHLTAFRWTHIWATFHARVLQMRRNAFKNGKNMLFIVIQYRRSYNICSGINAEIKNISNLLFFAHLFKYSSAQRLLHTKDNNYNDNIYFFLNE